jgi:tRNA U38,U39,U40 pseudouridine synthase TruA
MTVVRRSLGYRRYVFSVQYHGSSFLGFSLQGNQENTILPDGTDLRGYRTVEGRLRQALQNVFPIASGNCSDSSSDSSHGGFENLQVSSRTDRGVHALKNTFHVDLWNQNDTMTARQIHRGVNFFLSRQRELQQPNYDDDGDNDENTNPNNADAESSLSLSPKPRRRLRSATQVIMGDNWVRHDPMNELRVLNVKEAPLYMDNPGAAESERDQPSVVDWNARFSATQRTYMYRILHTHHDPMHNSSNMDDIDIDSDNNDSDHNDSCGYTDWAAPFEWDRSWRITDQKQQKRGAGVGGEGGPLDTDRMRAAAAHLQGTHDFSSFQATGCQRKSPVTTIHTIDIHSEPYGPPLSWKRNPNDGSGGGGGILGLGSSSSLSSSSAVSSCQLVTILFSGNSFLYRQVRNMVSCLVKVGRGQLKPDDVKSILAARKRSRGVPGMAPAHGLFLVDVQHGNFSI